MFRYTHASNDGWNYTHAKTTFLELEICLELQSDRCCQFRYTHASNGVSSKFCLFASVFFFGVHVILIFQPSQLSLSIFIIKQIYLVRDRNRSNHLLEAYNYHTSGLVQARFIY